MIIKSFNEFIYGAIVSERLDQLLDASRLRDIGELFEKYNFEKENLIEESEFNRVKREIEIDKIL